jgi:hypothetical protein
MSFPTYFSNLPDLKYAVSVNKAGQTNDILIKDYFKLLRLREDVKRTSTFYVDYVVQSGERPDQIAFKEYGEEGLYWMILQANDIVDYDNQWPLSSSSLDQYITEKYGVNGGSGVHHYETVEEYDADGGLMLPGGMIVDEQFSHDFLYAPGVRRVSYPSIVTNFRYESELNNQKSQIQIINRDYVWDVLRESRNYYQTLKNDESKIDIYNVLRRKRA